MQLLEKLKKKILRRGGKATENFLQFHILTASYAHETWEKASEANAKHTGWGWGLRAKSPPPTQSSHPFSVFSSVSILSARSTIEWRYEKTKGCEQSKETLR